jgi:hypothetical protein
MGAEGATMMTQAILQDRYRPSVEVQSVSVIKTRDAADWVLPAIRQIASLEERLSYNWDGYGSGPLSREALRSARRFIDLVGGYNVPAPEIAPVTGGGINLSWELSTKEVEIEFLPSGDVVYLATEAPIGGSRRHIEGESLGSQLTVAKVLVQWLLT